MADNNFRGSRGPFGRDTRPAERDAVSDPLAELARLIGQSDAHGGRGRDRSAEEFDDAPTALDWGTADQEYVHPRSEQSYRLQPSDDASRPRGRASEEEPDRDRQYVRPPVGYAEAGRDPGRNADMRDSRFETQWRPPGSRAEPSSYVPPAHDNHADDHGQFAAPAADQREHEGYDHDYEQYEGQGSPVRRSGTGILVAVLGLAVLGTAGALGYRAMFGGPMIPSLPPIIKPSDTPVKIVPKHDAQASLSQADAGQKGGDKLVTDEEQPVDLQSVTPVPHVVTTIPVISNAPDAPLPGGAGAAEPGAPSPSPSPAAFGDSHSPAQQFGVAMPAAPALAEVPPGSKPVRTVTILPQQRPASVQEPGPPPSEPAEMHSTQIRRSVTRPIGEERTASAGPLSIVPDRGGRVTRPPPVRAPRTEVARESGPMALTSSVREPVGAARGGGYAVQVTSQRSEADAQAAFRSLQAKFPRQLGDRRVFVRRADLGAKGVYYRALVGPFASAEQATSLCSSLKAAGGSCLIQRN